MSLAFFDSSSCLPLLPLPRSRATRLRAGGAIILPDPIAVFPKVGLMAEGVNGVPEPETVPPCEVARSLPDLSPVLLNATNRDGLRLPAAEPPRRAVELIREGTEAGVLLNLLLEATWSPLYDT